MMPLFLLKERQITSFAICPKNTTKNYIHEINIHAHKQTTAHEE